MLNDLRTAFAFLTILPVGYPTNENPAPGRSFAYYPLVGLLIGGALFLVMSSNVFARDFTVFLALLVWVVLTGGLHLDGLGDSCDALFATTTPERRLGILKDPRAGTWAVVGLVLVLLGKWVLLRGLSPTMLLLVPPIIGRWTMVIAAYAFPYAREIGLGAYFRNGLGRAQVATASGLMLLIVLSVRPVALLTAVVGLVVAFGLGSWAARRLNGGLTGDVYGAMCEVTELTCLIVLSEL
jgi:adenosylcobinamide-GDP ribazoletransferase